MKPPPHLTEQSLGVDHWLQIPAMFIAHRWGCLQSSAFIWSTLSQRLPPFLWMLHTRVCFLLPSPQGVAQVGQPEEQADQLDQEMLVQSQSTSQLPVSLENCELCVYSLPKLYSLQVSIARPASAYRWDTGARSLVGGSFFVTAAPFSPFSEVA